MIRYEYPFNERIRTLLRLEDLYDRADYFIAQNDAVLHHTALLTIFDILEVATRADLKSDLLQELERQKQLLSPLRNNPAISQEALGALLQSIEETLNTLHGMTGKFGQHLRENEWLMGIKQRTSIPGGVCEFDLPSYHYWLHQPAALRRQDLNNWMTPMCAIRNGLSIILKLLRENGQNSSQVATNGVYQQMLGGKIAQMVRIEVADELACVPEISANKYALNVRFLSSSNVQRGGTCEQDIRFTLTFCNL